MSKPHVAVLMGGLSSERDVSFMSGKGVVKALETCGYPVTAVDVGRDIGQVLAELKPDVAFIALHGPYGEDGCIQGLLNIMNIPYTHSGVLASSVGMDKVRSSQILSANGILCTLGKVISRGDVDTKEKDLLPRPYVVKPLFEGSSIGVHLIFEGDDFDFREYDWPYGDTVIVERYVPGKEVQVAVVNNKAIGAIEIRPKGRFYDYEAKYTDGMAEHIMPAPVPDDVYQSILTIAEKAHILLGCRGVSRADFRYDDTEGGDGKAYLLEINTHPGLTPLSLVPEITAYYGISYNALVEMLVQEAQCDY